MRAGGVWHGGGSGEARRTRGFQLWVALPPELELGPSESVYLSTEIIPHDGPERVLLGATDLRQVRSMPLGNPVEGERDSALKANTIPL
jgi:hypothetical protein